MIKSRPAYADIKRPREKKKKKKKKKKKEGCSLPELGCLAIYIGYVPHMSICLLGVLSIPPQYFIVNDFTTKAEIPGKKTLRFPVQGPSLMISERNQPL
jgi:hypothetical protein